MIRTIKKATKRNDHRRLRPLQANNIQITAEINKTSMKYLLKSICQHFPSENILLDPEKKLGLPLNNIHQIIIYEKLHKNPL